MRAQNPLPKYRGRKSAKIVQAGKIAQKQKSGRPVWTGLPLFVSVYRYRCKLFSSDSTGGASALASAAIDASVCVHNCNAIVNGDCTNRASALASAAANTCVRNLVCHNRTLLISRAVIYEETCPCTAVAGSLGNLILDTILAKQNQKGKTNRTAQNAKPFFLLGCTKAQANFWRKLKRFFSENHEIWLVLTD